MGHGQGYLQREGRIAERKRYMKERERETETETERERKEGENNETSQAGGNPCYYKESELVSRGGKPRQSSVDFKNV